MFAATLLLVSFAPASAHPDSRSSSLAVVDSARGHVRLELHCQARSLDEALELDANEDGALDEAELTAARTAIESYAVEHYRLYAGAVESLAGASAMRGALRELRLVPAADSALDEPWIDLALEYDHGAALDALTVHCRLFREQNPYHRDEARIQWNDEVAARRLFSLDSGDLWVFRPASARRGGVLADYTHEGFLHILRGYDHLAFLCGLIFAARRLRSVVGTITAFTLAHSITLALAALGWVRAPSALVEMAIALSISYVGALNLLSKEPGARWGEAFVFGLIHGLGFAGAIGDALAYEPLKLTALFGFNLGVECGQLAVVVPVALLLHALPGSRESPSQPRAWLAPRWARLGGSAVVAALGLYWFLARTGIFSA
jgi:hypothetical protein